MKHAADRDALFPQQIPEGRFGILIDGGFVRASRTAEPISAVIDQERVGAEPVNLTGFGVHHLFKHVAVSVKHQDRFSGMPGCGRSRDPPRVQLIPPVYRNVQILKHQTYVRRTRIPDALGSRKKKFILREEKVGSQR